MTRNHTVDFFRLLGAIFIMSLHTELGNLDERLVSITKFSSRWAVPFFFICSGYFLGKKFVNKSSLSIDLIKGSVVKYISILLVVSIVYIPIDIYKKYHLFDISNLLTGSYIHLWFIGGLLFSYIFIWYFYELGIQKWLKSISIILFLLAIIADSYDHLFGLNIDYDLFRFLSSIPFVYSGILIAKYNDLATQKPWILILLCLVAISSQFIEGFYFEKTFGVNLSEHQMLMSIIPLSFFIFLLTLSLKINNNLLSRWGNKYSLWIYLYHPFFFVIISILYDLCFNEGYKEFEKFILIPCFILTLFSGILLEKYSPKIYGYLSGNVYIKK